MKGSIATKGLLCVDILAALGVKLQKAVEGAFPVLQKAVRPVFWVLLAPLAFLLCVEHSKGGNNVRASIR